VQNVCRRCGSVASFLLLVWCMCAVAQTRVFIDIDQVGGYLLPIAIPKLMGEQVESALGEQIRAIFRADLELSGLFRIVDPATYIDEVPEALDHLRYQNWSTVGAMGVIAGRVQRSAGEAQLKLDFTLHDVVQQRPRFNGREYTGTREQYREMAHRFSDLVFREFTGEDGPFNTQVVCVTPRRAGTKAKDIVLMDYDGYGAQNLVADGALNLAPTLSPDSTLLAYTSYRSGSPQIYLRQLFTGVEERLTAGGGLALPGSWSPDGRYLALSQTADGNTDLYLYDTRQKRLTQLTTDWGIDVSPNFAPDGKRLVFVSDRSGTPQIYLTDTSGRAASRLTYDGRYNTSPVWSPRGDVIAFVGRSEGQRQTLDVYTMRVDGSRVQRLTNSGSDNEAPTWAPNGRFVMYTSLRGGGWQRRLMRENGQGDRSLTANGTACLSPQWVARPAR
jgi:TolB protein